MQQSDAGRVDGENLGGVGSRLFILVINLLHKVWPGSAWKQKIYVEGCYQFLFIFLLLLSLSALESFILLRRIPGSLFCCYV